MGIVNFVFCSIGKCFDIICFLLELNFVIVNSLIRLVVASISFINSLPMLLTNSVLECWNITLFCIITMMDWVSVVAHNMVGGWEQLLGGVLEGFKMVGFLSSHVLLRTRELMHRGLLSAHCLLRQAWEGCGIALSLVLYFANTIVNLLLIGTQNLYAVLVGMWEAVSCPLQKALELTLAVLTFLYSSLVGTSLLLWTPCQLAMEFLGSLSHILASVFLLNDYGLAFTVAAVAVVASATVYLSPAPARRGARRGARRVAGYVNGVPALRQLQRTLRRLSLVEVNVWRQLAAWQGSRAGLGTAPAYRGGDAGRAEPDAGRGAAEGDAAGGGPSGDATGPARPLRPTPPADGPLEPAPPSSSTERTLRKARQDEEEHKGPPDDSLLSLLEEQEERKKCVICQDSTKTVVLLPCRHLCLCRDCTTILLRQPIYQHNCPLCRHMILRTMDVYL